MKFWKHGVFIKLSKHKGLETECGFNKKFWCWFEFSIRWDKHVDHAGFHFTFELIGIWFTFSIYDFRHWHNYNNCWVKYKD